MKDSLLLLMTPGMSLEKWHNLGQLSRELNYYAALCNSSGLKLLIYSYGRNDSPYLKQYANFKVLCMPAWIPENLPFRVQNVLYQVWSLVCFRSHFSKVVITKTNQFSASSFGLLIKAFYGIPLIIRMGYYYSHFLGMSLIKKLNEQIAFRLCDLIMVTSSEASGFIKSKYGISETKVLCMYNAIDLELFRPLAITKEYDLMFIGRFEKQKNIALLAEVLSSLNMRSLIVGNGSLSTLIRAAAEKNQLIQWKEKIDNSDLPLYYNSSRCFILLSEYEGSPKVLLEAMACGVPGVGTAVPGTRECIDHGNNGILVGTDAVEVKNAILTLFKDAEALSNMGGHASVWVRKHCDMTKNINKEINFYHMLPVYQSFSLQTNQKISSC